MPGRAANAVPSAPGRAGRRRPRTADAHAASGRVQRQPAATRKPPVGAARRPRARRRRSPRAPACRSARGRPVAASEAPRPSSSPSAPPRRTTYADPAARARGPGVLDRVGESLLHDPVGGEVDPGRERARSPSNSQLDVRPAARVCSTSCSSWSSPGCGWPARGLRRCARRMPNSRRISAIACRRGDARSARSSWASRSCGGPSRRRSPGSGWR